MKLNNYTSRNKLLADWICESIPKGGSALDVGANDGSFPEIERIAKWVSTLSGVDPDTDKLSRNPHTQIRYFSSLENAKIPCASLDFLYAFHVLEHINNPDDFISSASRALKPGGSFFFITPNRRHYFALIASLLEKLKMQNRTLNILRGGNIVNVYHYPAVYKLNCPRDIERIGRKHGFVRYEYRYSETLGEIECYFPGITKIVPHLWEKMASLCRREDMLLNLMGRMIKSDS